MGELQPPPLRPILMAGAGACIVFRPLGYTPLVAGGSTQVYPLYELTVHGFSHHYTRIYGHAGFSYNTAHPKTVATEGRLWDTRVQVLAESARAAPCPAGRSKLGVRVALDDAAVADTTVGARGDQAELAVLADQSVGDSRHQSRAWMGEGGEIGDFETYLRHTRFEGGKLKPSVPSTHVEIEPHSAARGVPQGGATAELGRCQGSV